MKINIFQNDCTIIVIARLGDPKNIIASASGRTNLCCLVWLDLFKFTTVKFYDSDASRIAITIQHNLLKLSQSGILSNELSQFNFQAYYLLWLYGTIDA